ncbi:MAG TPA: GGDEF domain-containing protein [Gemmatimonadales bacterium]
MTPAPAFLLGLAVGIGAALLVARVRRAPRVAASPQPAAEGPPLLEWLMRSNGALGVWLVGPGTREVAVPGGVVPDELDRVVRARLEHQRVSDGQGVERLGSGTLVFASLDGRAAGLHLPPDSSNGARATALRDLARFLDYDRWRPVLVDVAKEQETPGESAESVALRLALQLERLLGVETCVALAEPQGVRIAGVSLHSDRQLLRTLVEQGSPMEQVAIGLADASAGVMAPVGSVKSDRRHRQDPAFICPIPGNGRPLGAVAVWTPEGAEPAGAMLAAFRAAIDTAGPRLAGALERQALTDAAVRDPLTGVRNRRGLGEVMTYVSMPVGALVYLDLDHFKQLNDALGHQAGDEALKHCSRILMQAVRDHDTVARLGGEEFAIWLPGASLERGRQVAERIRQALAWSEWKWQGQKWPLHASFGVAACPETSPTREGLPAQADAALYAAKRQGRDRVVVAAAPE